MRNRVMVTIHILTRVVKKDSGYLQSAMLPTSSERNRRGDSNRAGAPALWSARIPSCPPGLRYPYRPAIWDSTLVRLCLTFETPGKNHSLNVIVLFSNIYSKGIANTKNVLKTVEKSSLSYKTLASRMSVSPLSFTPVQILLKHLILLVIFF